MNKEQKKLAFFYIIISVLGRIIPHPANVTPLTNICLWSGQKLPRYLAIVVVLFSIAISDVALAAIYHYPIFGVWSLFSYSGFLAIALFSSRIKAHSIFKTLGFLLASTLGFWLWSNFGSWLIMGYPKNSSGLFACYTMALPFLRNAVLGDLGWFAIILATQRCCICRRSAAFEHR